jgi:hypothetical protein
MHPYVKVAEWQLYFVQLSIIPVRMSCMIRQVTVGCAACPLSSEAGEEGKGGRGGIHDTPHISQPSVSLLRCSQ